MQVTQVAEARGVRRFRVCRLTGSYAIVVAIPPSLHALVAWVHECRPAHTSGSEIWEAPGRETGKLRENRGKVIAHWELQPTPALPDRENRQVDRTREPYEQASMNLAKAYAIKCV